MQEILYLQNKQIDKLKWDESVKSSKNWSIYALSWYLDIVSPGWSALVDKSYDSVMPLPSKYKFFIKYIIQPPLCQQLGLVSKNENEINNIDSFLKKIPNRFKYIHLNLSKSNNTETFKEYLRPGTNHEMSLKKEFQELYKSFSRRTIRNIKSANEAGLKITDTMSYEVFLVLKRTYAQPALTKNTQKILEKLCCFTIENNIGKIVAAVNSNNEFVAAAFYFCFKNRIYLSVTVSNNEGKEKSAMHLIVESIIREYAGQDYILDFTGSSLKGVAYFNEGFGAVPCTYFAYINNKLPLCLRFLKKK